LIFVQDLLKVISSLKGSQAASTVKKWEASKAANAEYQKYLMSKETGPDTHSVRIKLQPDLCHCRHTNKTQKTTENYKYLQQKAVCELLNCSWTLVINFSFKLQMK